MANKNSNIDKVTLISNLAEYLNSQEDCDNINITNTTREIKFTMGEQNYTMMLTTTRKSKDKATE